jgi:nitroreductase
MIDGDTGLFETIYNCRAMRRIKPDAVPDGLLVRLVDAAIRAPSTGNGHHWRFVIVRDRSIVGRMAEPWRRGNAFFTEIALAAPPRPGEDIAQRHRILRAATYLAKHLTDVPALICVCVERDRVAEAAARRGTTLRTVVRHLGLANALRLSLAARSNIERELWATAYPAVQNLLLAARALGLAAALTMPMVLAPPGTYEQILGLPKGVMLAAVIPVGYPEGRFGPVTRPPAESFISWDRYRDRAEQSS